MDSAVHDLTAAQWSALQAAWGGCAYCGAADKPLQRDCVLAISRGGRYTLDNIAPACGSCNASKCNEEVTSWLRRRRLDERAFLTRHLAIQRTLDCSSRCAGLTAVTVFGRGCRPPPGAASGPPAPPPRRW